MLWPIIAFDGILFMLLFAIFFVAQLVLASTRADAEWMLIWGGVFIVFCAVFVNVPWGDVGRWAAGYSLGAVIWLPTFWYLELWRKSKLLRAGATVDPEIHQSLYKTVGNRRVPTHPCKTDLVACTLLWFIAAPAYLGRNWISWIIEMLKSFMTRIQMSFGVDMPVDKSENELEDA